MPATLMETPDGRAVEFEKVALEPVRVRVGPNGDMDSANASKYMNKAPKTLAMWRMAGRGPAFRKAHGRIIYTVADCDEYMRGGE